MSSLVASKSRPILCRFALGFFLVNIILSLFVSINYFHLVPHFQSMVDGPVTLFFIWLFLAISSIAQVTLLCLGCCLLVILLTLMLPRLWLTFIVSTSLATILLLAIILDSVAFSLYHMHYAPVGLEILRVHAFSQVLSLSIVEIIWIVLAATLLFAIESCIAWCLWRFNTRANSNKIIRRLTLIFIACIITSYSVNFIARLFPGKDGVKNLTNSNLIIKAAQFIPYYDDFNKFLIPTHATLRQVNIANESVNLQISKIKLPLQYPLHSLQCKPAAQPLNILVIAIDAWRFDAMNAKVTPNIYRFAQKTSRFQDHWSGGNCTKSGLFSLFYGIPANYWDSFLQQKRGPELIQQLIKANYSMGIFASAQLNFPAFNQTIFRDVKSLMIRTPGKTTVERDKEITRAFQKFLVDRNPQQPFFGFVFYDAAHNYCESMRGEAQPFSPSVATCNRLLLNPNSDRIPYLNRYFNAMYFIDNQIQQIFSTLEQRGLLKNTIVILTADHGEEINDKHSGYWQHASAYTAYQLHVPLLVYWPEQQPKIYTHFTSHYDIAPTILSQVLQCTNPLKEYTIGQPLFSVGKRPVLVSGSYADYALITKEQVVRIYNQGDYAIDDQYGHPLEGFSLKSAALQQAYEDLNFYYKKSP